jgi:hypothetical protein
MSLGNFTPSTKDTLSFIEFDSKLGIDPARRLFIPDFSNDPGVNDPFFDTEIPLFDQDPDLYRDQLINMKYSGRVALQGATLLNGERKTRGLYIGSNTINVLANFNRGLDVESEILIGRAGMFALTSTIDQKASSLRFGDMSQRQTTYIARTLFAGKNGEGLQFTVLSNQL